MSSGRSISTSMLSRPAPTVGGRPASGVMTIRSLASASLAMAILVITLLMEPRLNLVSRRLGTLAVRSAIP